MTKEKTKLLLKKILNIFFPEKLKCIFCGRDVKDFDETPICHECLKEGFFNTAPNRCKICDTPLTGAGDYCDHCKKDKKSFDKASAPFIYEGKVKNTVLKLKNDNAKYLAFPMAKIMSDRVLKEKWKFDLIIPVPLSQKSLKKRGFNQSLLLAKEIGKNLNTPVITNILIKQKETTHQKELGFDDRQKNLRGAFHLESFKELKGKSILLVDDVMTTSATANECSTLLKKHAKTVYVITFARTALK